MNSYHAFWNDRSGVGIRNSSLDPNSNDKKKRMSELKRESSKQESLIQTINELTEELEQERHQKDKLRKKLNITKSKLRASMSTDEIDTISIASLDFQTMEQKLLDLEIENQNFRKKLHDNKRSESYSKIMEQDKKHLKQELRESKKQITDLVHEIERLREEIHKQKAVQAMKQSGLDPTIALKSSTPTKSVTNIDEFSNEIESSNVIRVSSIRMESEPKVSRQVSIATQSDDTRRSTVNGPKIIVRHAKEQAQIKKLKRRNTELQSKLSQIERSSLSNNRSDAIALTKLSKGELIVKLIDTKRRKEAIHDKIAKIRVDAKKKNIALQQKFDILEQKYKELEMKSSDGIIAVTQKTNEELREKLARKNFDAATLRSRHHSLRDDSNIVLINMQQYIEKALKESKAASISLIATLKSTSKELSIKEADNYTKYWRNLIRRLHGDARKLVNMNKKDAKSDCWAINTNFQNNTDETDVGYISIDSLD